MGMYPVMGYGGPHPGAQQHNTVDTRNGFQEYGVFSESNGVLDPIGAVAFDPIEELVWSGSQTVRKILHDKSCYVSGEAGIGGREAINSRNPSAKRKRTDCTHCDDSNHLFLSVYDDIRTE